MCTKYVSLHTQVCTHKFGTKPTLGTIECINDNRADKMCINDYQLRLRRFQLNNINVYSQNFKRVGIYVLS